jgi:hypothetical protein
MVSLFLNRNRHKDDRTKGMENELGRRKSSRETSVKNEERKKNRRG